MTLKQFPHGTAFVEAFTVSVRGEVVGEPVGWGSASHEKHWLESALLPAVRDALARFYQCELRGVSLQVTVPDPCPSVPSVVKSSP